MSQKQRHKIHVALIPDGNRRWSRLHKKPEWYGHYVGARRMEDFLNWCLSRDEVETVTIYALSTENLNRSKKELDKLWSVYKKHLEKALHSKNVKEHQIKINVLGDAGIWRSDVKQAAKALMKTTHNYTRGVLNILIAYGSKFEIAHAVTKVLKFGVKSVPLLEQTLIKYLMVNKPVDLIIRTGGMQRLSNFLLYQSAYAEIYFSRTLWPDFSEKELERILNWYYRQEKKFGK